MFFYEVAPASRSYHGSELLTYSFAEKLEVGQIVEIKIRSKTAAGFIAKTTVKPAFKTLDILHILNAKLTSQQVALFMWLREYYPAPTGLIAQLFLPLAKVTDYEQNVSEHTPSTKSLKSLTKEQQSVIKQIDSSASKSMLLHGDTGTGKTQIYIQKSIDTLASGKSVLILIPEIALSPQIVKSFSEQIDAPITITHSGLTTVQRRKAWQSIAGHHSAQVVIGPRSALFTPLKNIGLIVIDEFHESAYKQDQAPYYQTLRVASKYAQLHDACLLLGSATPLISEYYVALAKQVPIIRMQQKAITNDAEITTKLVNLKDESEKSRSPLLSTTLLDEIATQLQQKSQVLLFLNKRGSARLILCQQCGWHADCERCDLPLTYHADNHRLLCHTCGWSRNTPNNCPVCGSNDINFKSPGTKAIAAAISTLFPQAHVARFDKDNLKAERLDSRHDEITSGDIDILIGTQLLAKGHDLPRLGLVGILLAENELQFPDYTSSERSFQLMHQLIGRVGRGHRPGTVVVQTYNPDTISVQAALGEQSFGDFYNTQLAERKLFDFPPFVHIMKIEVTRAHLGTVKKVTDQITTFLHASGFKIRISDPTPSFIEKKNNSYTWQIIVKSKDRSVLVLLARSIPFKCIVNLDPSNLL